jgi:hypothetical protein
MEKYLQDMTSGGHPITIERGRRVASEIGSGGTVETLIGSSF